MKRIRGLVIFTVLIGGCLTAEYLGQRRVDPTGRVSTLSDYLAWRPAASEFAAVEVNGTPHVIAYGPRINWLLSSGPSAYVFDHTGRLVDWSTDIGDDSEFDDKWNAQRSRGMSGKLSRSEVQTRAATQPGGHRRSGD